MIPIPDFATMTREEALDRLVDLDVRKWGEAEREPSRTLHGRMSRGLIINALVYHESTNFGAVYDAATKRAAAEQLTDDDLAELATGG